MRAVAVFLMLVLTAPALAWGPGAHEFLGREGALAAGLDARMQLAIASGSLLADLDHTLPHAGVVGDSAGFARAIVSAPGSGPLSDRFAAGWLAHVIAQDPGQHEIASRDAKLCADMILVRTAGFPTGAVVSDPERIRAAAQALGGAVPEAKDVTKAVEKLVLLALVETAALDMLPMELDLPNGALPSGRQLMPPELTSYERRLEGSRQATAQVVSGSLTELAAQLPAGQVHERAADVITLPPAALLGISISSRTIEGGLTLTTARLAHPLLFKTAIRLVVHKLGARVFPTATSQWSEGARVGAVTRELEAHLEESTAAIEALFPR